MAIFILNGRFSFRSSLHSLFMEEDRGLTKNKDWELELRITELEPPPLPTLTPYSLL